MKANELMTGDWVLVNGTPMQIQAVDAIDGEIMAGDELYCLIEDRVHSEDKIEPVPLTAEILEKNGFVEQEYGWRKLNAANWCININIFNGKERYALSVLGINAQVTLHGYYVHELQHASRLCKIDKEITI